MGKFELKLAYRTLRKISDWAVTGYYDDVNVQGYENVPKDGPVIIVSTHHNEIIDIATLAATIPHRRHVSFWAKSSMFKNPIVGGVLSSSGTIPVNRNPNRGADAVASSNQSQSSLFMSSSQALAQDGVLGVFPEGTSYTQPSIVQIMSGAGWAAVEYVKWEHERAQKKVDDNSPQDSRLVIVPVTIVYTDKSRYLSRITVQYGSPIKVSDYTHDLFTGNHDPDERARTAVKQIMSTIESRLFEMTINAPDWETLYAARTARDILWGEERNISLPNWVPISQTLVRLLDASSEDSLELSEPLIRARTALTRYYSLLHHTSLTHSLVEKLLPLPFAVSPSSPYPNRVYHIKTLVKRVIRPSLLFSLPLDIAAFILFIPAFITHIPAYLTSHILVKVLATPGEEEGIAQYAAVGAGIGFGAGILGGSWKLALRCMQALYRQDFVETPITWLRENASEVIPNVKPSIGVATEVVRAIASHVLWKTWPGKLLSTILCGWAMIKWHGLFIRRFHSKFKELVATTRLQYLLALIRPATWSLPPGRDVEPYTQLPPPPTNEFIRKRTQTRDDEADRPTPPPVPSRQLMSGLLDARETAKRELWSYSQELAKRDKSVVDWLQVMGARLSQL
ncbi:hypothetical protein VNI00_005287 [Paramarasmius palmivorus]|uniref:Phospholipid/glycerol acyltransferase domain-containing protein n=1 Tax=Paramarasmius palmivorus TaxID=297713 RepID=A0AAW0DFN5_9AGAR